MGCNPALILSQLTHSVQPGVFSCLPPCGTPTNQVHVRLGQKEGAGLGAGDAGHEAQKPGTSVAMGRPNGETQVQACPHCNTFHKGGPDGGWLTPLQTSRARSAAPASTWFQRHALFGWKGTLMCEMVPRVRKGAVPKLAKEDIRHVVSQQGQGAEDWKMGAIRESQRPVSKKAWAPFCSLISVPLSSVTLPSSRRTSVSSDPDNTTIRSAMGGLLAALDRAQAPLRECYLESPI